jgi:hypothetical protein
MMVFADFNDLESKDRITVDLDDFEGFLPSGGPSPGTRLELSDEAGHYCIGVVIATDPARSLAEVRLDWTTWRSTRFPSPVLVASNPQPAEVVVSFREAITGGSA